MEFLVGNKACPCPTALGFEQTCSQRKRKRTHQQACERYSTSLVIREMQIKTGEGWGSSSEVEPWLRTQALGSALAL